MPGSLEVKLTKQAYKSRSKQYLKAARLSPGSAVSLALQSLKGVVKRRPTIGDGNLSQVSDAATCIRFTSANRHKSRTKPDIDAGGATL